MEVGNESWKWGLVVILFVIFVFVAHQAYVSINSQEDYPPPDDYLQGDSFDIEHKSGPGAGQPMNVPPDLLGSATAMNQTSTNQIPIQQPGQQQQHPQQEEHSLDQIQIDLNQVGNPAKAD